MHTPKRTRSYLIQLRADGTPGLYGRVQALGEEHVVTFASARELVEALRQFLLIACDEDRNDSHLTDSH